MDKITEFQGLSHYHVTIYWNTLS